MKFLQTLRGIVGTSPRPRVDFQQASTSADSDSAPEVDYSVDEEFELRLDADEALEARIASLASPHLKTFARKYHQLILIDDYGNKVVDKWHAELRYFIEKVVMLDEKVNALLPLSSVPGFSKFMTTNERLVMLLDLYIVGHNWETVIAAANGAYVPSMGGVDFEKFVASKLEMAGFIVRHTPASGDQGADLLAEQGRERIAVQCKRSSSPVGNKAVQEAAAGRGFYGATSAWVVSDAAFTNAAKHLAQRLNVRLLHHSELDSA